MTPQSARFATTVTLHQCSRLVTTLTFRRTKVENELGRGHSYLLQL